MLEAHGLLQLTMRSESYRLQAQLISRNNAATVDSKSTVDTTGGRSSGSSGAKSAITLPKGATSGPMTEFWQRAADKAAQHAPSADTIKKLQDASKDDNKEIAAQKMQQAKAKLQSLRLQAQLAAASGDKQQLRRLAQEVAAAARDVASAAHDLAGGIVDSVGSGSTPVPQTVIGSDGTTTDGTATDGAEAGDKVALQADEGDAGADAGNTVAPLGGAAQQAAARDAGNASASGGTETAANDASGHGDNDPLGTVLKEKSTPNNTPLYAQDAPEDGDKFAWGRKALNSLSTDADNALSQARGLLAFIASLVRGKRKSGEGNEDDRFFNELQRQVDDAQASVNHDISNASQQLVADQTSASDTTAGDSGDGSLFGMTSITVTQVTTTAVFLNITT